MLTPPRLAGWVSALLCAFVLAVAHAQVSVVPASGGGAISADSTGGAWTTLTGPELDETSRGGGGAFGTGTIVLNAPAGFEFNPAATVVVSVGRVAGSGSTNNQIDIGAGRGNSNTATVTATTITIDVAQTSRFNTQNSLTWSGIEVRPTAGCALASGNITESGTSSFTLSSASLGTLTEVIGATRMYTVLPGQSFTACSGVSGSPTGQSAGAAFNLVSLVVADQWGNIDATYGGSKAISYSGPSGSNSYTSPVAFSAGVSTVTLATTINVAQTTTLTATDGTVPGAASTSFTISAPSCTTPPWYNTAWLYRKAITIDHTKVAGSLAGFPVLVSVTDGDLQANAQASGNDILFTDSSGTAKLAHEVERYTSATGELIAWVNVPNLSAGADTVIYMYYGNSAAPAQQNPAGVWDANYRGVWHLQESGNGSANEYKDSTANANNARGGNGSAGATPSRVAGKIGYAQSFNGSQLINGSSSGSLPNINADQTISFWYEVATNPPTARTNFLTLRTAGGGAANQAVFVGAVSGPCASYPSPLGATQWGGACTIDTNAPPAGSWHYFVFTHAGSTNTLYLDGAQVSTNTAALQTGAIGDYIWGSYTTTPAESLTGLMDETRVSNTARSAAWIQTQYNNQGSPATFLSVGAQQTQACYTHYAVTFPGGSTAATCETAQVTITAHDSSHNPGNPPAGTTLNVSTSSGAGVWTGLVAGAGTLSGNGANNGQATYIWAGGESSITLDLRQNTPATININLLDSGGKIENPGTEDPNLTFADSAFRVTADGSSGASVGTQIAGKPSNGGFGSQILYLQAIRTDTATGSCVGLIPNRTVNVELAGARLNPTGGASALSVLDSGGTLRPVGTGAGAPGAYSSVAFAFDAQSKAPLVLSYPDAGAVALYARYALPAPPAATYVSGSSNAFVVRPFGLRVDGVTTAAAPSPSSPVFAKAGQSFNVTLTAVQWQAGDDANGDGVPDSDAQIASNPATPNFGQESTPATAVLSSTLNAPAGGSAGTLGGATTFSAFSAGARTQTVNWSEVGFIDLHALAANYLGAGQDVSNSSAGLTGVGRFIPDHFALSGGTLTNRAAAACAPASSFSYLGEGVRLQYVLAAQNAANAPTQNYSTASGYAKLTGVPAGMGFGAVDGSTNLTSRLDLANSGALSWSAGAASVDYTLAVNRASPDNPDGPFAAAKIGIAPQDADGVGLAASAFDMDVDGVGGNDHEQVGAGTQLRFGRLRMQNALGPIASPLPVPLTAEYWNGSAFATNALDSCTRIPRSAIVLDSYEGALAPGGGNCKTYVQQNPVAFSAGVGTLTLAAPTAGAGGSVRLTPNLGTAASGNYCQNAASGETPASAAALPYLLGRWNDTLDPDAIPATMYDDNPSARAAFGLYGSQPDNLIFQRENY